MQDPVNTGAQGSPNVSLRYLHGSEGNVLRNKIPSPSPETASPRAEPAELLRQPSKSVSLRNIASATSDGGNSDSMSSGIKAVSRPPAAQAATSDAATPRQQSQNLHQIHTHVHTMDLPEGPPQYAPPTTNGYVYKPRTPRGHTPKGSTGATSIDLAVRSPSSTAGQPANKPKVKRGPSREMNRMMVEQQAPARFICPISGRIMRDPIILATGATCDRESMERWLAKQHRSCPVTRQLLKKPINMIPNVEMRNQITTWAAKYAPWMMDREGFLKSAAPPKDSSGQVEIDIDELADAAPGAGNAQRSNSRSYRNATSTWQYTQDGKLVTNESGSKRETINANSSTVGTQRSGPWSTHRGLASAPKAGAESRSPTRRPSQKKSTSKKIRANWVSISFLAAVSMAHIGMFLMALAKDSWKLAPLSSNPWYGASPAAVEAAGAISLHALDVDGQWWRLASATFLPAGIIHLAVAVLGVWVYGIYSAKVLPLPQVCVPAVYLLPAAIGALVTVNLDATYIACGAFGGMCALLGCVLADQVLNGKTHKMLNIKQRWLSITLLLLNAAAFITFSVLPLATPWFPAAGFVAGFALSMVLLALPKLEKGKSGNAALATTQIVCAASVIALATAAIVGVALPTKLGENMTFLPKAACVDLKQKFWTCQPYSSIVGGATAYPPPAYLPPPALQEQAPAAGTPVVIEPLAPEPTAPTPVAAAEPTPVAQPPAVPPTPMIPVTTITPISTQPPAPAATAPTPTTVLTPDASTTPTTTPAAPVVATPTAPAIGTPAAPVVGTPAAPTTAQPAGPAAATPVGVPAPQAPTVPVSGIPTTVISPLNTGSSAPTTATLQFVRGEQVVGRKLRAGGSMESALPVVQAEGSVRRGRSASLGRRLLAGATPL